MYKVEVTKVVGLNKTTKSIRFRLVDKKQVAAFAFVPGQFIMLGVLGYGEAPLTVTTAPAELPEFEVAVRSTGVATQAMHRLKVGDVAYARGPLGNSIITKKIYGKQLILIAGGIGLAPLRSMIHMIRDDNKIVGNLQILCGAKTPEALLYKHEIESWGQFADVHLIVDKADHHWTGKTGRIPDLLGAIKVEKEAVAVICGPPVMYEALAKKLLQCGLDADNIAFMLERRMRCGTGKCQHCTCGDKYVCIDGPTFTYQELAGNWEALR